MNKENVEIILTAKVGINADLFPDILKLYVPEGSWVLDMTYGTGVFWKQVDMSLYTLVANDIDPARGEFSYDLADLPEDWTDKADTVILDPPYKLTGTKHKKDHYGNESRGRNRAWGLYEDGIREAVRVLKKGGMLIVKCMDQVALHKQNWMHIFVYEQAMKHKMIAIDLFVLVRTHARPQPHKYQIHGRKNHSFFWVFRNGGGTII